MPRVFVQVSADRHARAVRGHRYRPPGLVPGGIAAEVRIKRSHLGPVPVVLVVQGRGTGENGVVPVRADHQTRAV